MIIITKIIKLIINNIAKDKYNKMKIKFENEMM